MRVCFNTGVIGQVGVIMAQVWTVGHGSAYLPHAKLVKYHKITEITIRRKFYTYRCRKFLFDYAVFLCIIIFFGKTKQLNYTESY